jgi:filamentous hemagglutinin family protein
MAGSVGTAGTGTMARRRDGGLLLGLALGVMLLGPAPGRAEVATDGTLGAKVRLTGRDVKIPARLGQVRGKNLFHSFQRFGIDTGGKVTFTGPDGLKNVIGRVTGGEPSRINGTLASRVSGADLWLLNPAGILFGPDARLDVPGSFHASTADELRFADGAVFSALDPQGSVLSVAEPQAFGFLRAKPAGIMVDQSVLKVNEARPSR